MNKDKSKSIIKEKTTNEDKSKVHDDISLFFNKGNLKENCSANKKSQSNKNDKNDQIKENQNYINNGLIDENLKSKKEKNFEGNIPHLNLRKNQISNLGEDNWKINKINKNEQIINNKSEDIIDTSQFAQEKKIDKFA